MGRRRQVAGVPRWCALNHWVGVPRAPSEALCLVDPTAARYRPAVMRTLVAALVLATASLVGAQTRLAPNGAWVGGTPQLAPDGTWVGGQPQLAPNGAWVGGSPQLAPNGRWVGGG